MFVLQLYS